MFVPLYLQTAGWDSGFGAQGWFHTLGRQLQRPPLLAGWRGAVWVHGMFAISWVTLIVSIGIQSIPRELEEAASLDGGMWQTLRCIAIPYVIPSLIVAAVWIFVTTAGEITVTDVYQIRTYAEELYIGYARNVPEALSKVAPLQISRWFGVVLTAWLTLGTLAVCVWLWPARSTHSTRNAYEYELRHFRWPIGIAVGLFFAFWCGVPVGNLLYQLGITVSQVGDERIRGWSLVKGAKLLASAPGSFQEELGWTLLISQAAALAAILIGRVPCLAGVVKTTRCRSYSHTDRHDDGNSWSVPGAINYCPRQPALEFDAYVFVRPDYLCSVDWDSCEMRTHCHARSLGRISVGFQRRARICEVGRHEFTQPVLEYRFAATMGSGDLCLVRLRCDSDWRIDGEHSIGTTRGNYAGDSDFWSGPLWGGRPIGCALPLFDPAFFCIWNRGIVRVSILDAICKVDWTM